ncbi:MAG: MBL fold metallo-hydrolase [Actinobacteria bacterium]|nr:MBL fold metallo-hydrolase [Actinomycetota bacterium]
MRVTFLGHVGMFVETEGGSVLCDPWFSPAYFGSWFPFPRNDRLDVEPFANPDYLYVSHLHLDHFDPAFLEAHVDKRAQVLLPAFELDHLERALRAVGFTRFVHTEHAKPVRLGALEVGIVAMTAPADGPAGDSALVLGDASARILNQNDARPRDLHELEALGPYDAHFTQFSGAIWYPMVYDFPPAERRALGIRKREDQMERAMHYLRDVGAPHVFPVAGPPCFLDDDLFGVNDLDDDPANIFPDQTVFLALLEQGGISGGELLVPGTVAEITHSGCTFTQPGGELAPESIFADKRGYLERYRADYAGWLADERASWPRRRFDVVRELKEWFEPLLELAPLTRAGVGAPVLLDLSDSDAGVAVVIDFPVGEVREWAGEDCPYRFEVERALVEALIEARDEDWVNRLFLSCRFRAHRDGPYNEYVYTFFKCLSVERMAFCEGYYASRVEVGTESFRCGDYLVQKRCPHLRADLERFGVVHGGVLECRVHHWEFDLETGRCLTSGEAEHRLRTERVVDY